MINRILDLISGLFLAMFLILGGVQLIAIIMDDPNVHSWPKWIQFVFVMWAAVSLVLATIIITKNRNKRV